VPPRASIQEALVLAEKFATTESPRFVNGVLDALLREVEGGARGAGEPDRRERGRPPGTPRGDRSERGERGERGERDRGGNERG
jgi:hypothetical protein